MLVEVSKKLWVAIIIQRIQKHWKKYHIINPANHAYTETSNTDFAIIQMLNTFECARDQRGTIAMGSWDYEKAFDSPAKVILLLAWVRLGVPPDKANYIVNMDIGGKIIVKSQYALEQQRKHGYHNLLKKHRKKKVT